MHQLLRGRTVVVSAFVVLLVYIAGLTLFWNVNRTIAAENALMENLQAGCLAFACVLLIPCLMRSALNTSRFVSWSLLLVFFSMLLREVDVESLSVPTAVASIGSGRGRNILLGSAFIATFIVLVRRRQLLIGQLTQFAFSRTSVLVAAGCALYVSSLPFDDSLLGLPPDLNQFCEEAVECGATYMFLIAAVVNLAQYTVAVRTKPAEVPTPIPTSRMAA